MRHKWRNGYLKVGALRLFDDKPLLLTNFLFILFALHRYFSVENRTSEGVKTFFYFLLSTDIVSRKQDVWGHRRTQGSHGAMPPLPLGPVIRCWNLTFNLLFHKLIMVVASFHLFWPAWRSGLERRFFYNHDRKVNSSTPNPGSLMRPWIRCFTMIISAWWNLASSKLKKSEENSTGKTWKQRQLLSESGFVPRIAPPPLSRDRRIKMKKSIIIIINQSF